MSTNCVYLGMEGSNPLEYMLQNKDPLLYCRPNFPAPENDPRSTAERSPQRRGVFGYHFSYALRGKSLQSC